MKRLSGLWPALLCLAAFAFSATLWASADLGVSDAKRQFAAQLPSQPLSVYSRKESGAPEVTGEAVRTWAGLTGVKCALPIAEVSVKLEGYGFSEDGVALGVPESGLSAAGIALASGSMPHSAWQPEALLGSMAAEKLASDAQAAGQSMPGHITLSITGQTPALDVFIRGVAAATGTERDNALWMDRVTLEALTAKNADSTSKADGLPVARADIYGSDVLLLDKLAERLTEQGFLVMNPVEKSARVIGEGQEMAQQWAILAMLAGIAALLAAWRRKGQGSLFGALASAAACMAGMLSAVVLIQAAMLLGWHFIISGEARYLLDVPRVIAIFSVCAAICGLRAATPVKRAAKSS